MKTKKKTKNKQPHITEQKFFSQSVVINFITSFYKLISDVGLFLNKKMKIKLNPEELKFYRWLNEIHLKYKGEPLKLDRQTIIKINQKFKKKTS